MNWMEMQTDWAKFSPLLTTWWAKLNEHDLPKIAGDRQRLAALLCERYGLESDAAEGQICAFEKDVRLPGAVK